MFDFLPLAQPAGLSPALLAYVGDAVFEVYVRSVLAAKWREIWTKSIARLF